MKRIFTITYLFLAMSLAHTQEVTLTLEEAIALAQVNSLPAVTSKYKIENAYWNYQLFLTELKPNLSFSAAPLPFFNRSINIVTQPDGRDIFVQRSLMRNAMEIQLQQYVPWTGGTFYASTSLQRIDIFGTDRSSSYFSVPIRFGFVQPFFRFDPIFWNKQIQPIRLKEEQHLYAEALERITFETVQVFFEAYLAQVNLEAAQRNKIIADTLYQIAKRRFEVGTLPKTDVLQLELESKNAEVDAAEANIRLRATIQALSNLTGLEKIGILVAPLDVPNLDVNVADALKYAAQNRSYPITSHRTLLEATSEIDKAKKSNGVNISASGAFGLSQTGATLGEAYNGLLDQEELTLGITIPIADWGKAKANRALAQSNYDLAKTSNEQIHMEATREIIVNVEQLPLLREKMLLAKRSTEIANTRSEITRQRYAIGTETVVELNLSLESAENSRLRYFNAIRDFWIGYYTIRQLTLFDFERGVILGSRE